MIDITTHRDPRRLGREPFSLKVYGEPVGVQDGEVLWQLIQAIRDTARRGRAGWQSNSQLLRSLRHVVVRAMLARPDLRDRFRATWKRARDRLATLEKEHWTSIPYDVPEFSLAWW
jgi:hypothetical protein